MMRTLLGNVTFVPEGVLTVFGRKLFFPNVALRSTSYKTKKFTITLASLTEIRKNSTHPRASRGHCFGHGQVFV